MATVPKPPQFVMLAFDGSKNVDFWKASRSFASANNIRFTYFMSGVYFLLDADKNTYVEPEHGTGKSNIGFGGTSLAVMKDRLEQVRLAMAEGHEMASHANGHFDGSAYTIAQWESEFTQFTRLMSQAWERYNKPAEPAGWKSYFANNVLGFRAPLLGVGNRTAVWKALKTHALRYDTSLVADMGHWPKKIDTIWSFPLAGLRIVGSGKRTLSMDYNFYFAQSKGVPGPASKHQEYEDQMFKTYVAYFDHSYFGNRAPIHIGHHFSLWNGGAYWKALQRFARYAVSKPNVICGTYKELLSFIETNIGKLPDYEAGNFTPLATAGRHATAAPKRRMSRPLTEDDLEKLRHQHNEPAHAHGDE
jgi:hypothetical protein